MLVARDLDVSVAGAGRILGPVSLEISPGSLVALMGGSGSGKSTLLRVLAGVTAPTAGTATWNDRTTAGAVHALGYVPQRESVYDRLTPREALRYAARLRLDERAAGEDRVDRVLAELDLLEQGDTLIRNLSGGERRRAACGLELVGDQRVLLLDEPTSGLDAVLERRLMELFRRLADHGRAVLVATHATASLDLCDEVVVLEGGRVAYRGGPEGARARLESGAGVEPSPAPPSRLTGGSEPPRAPADDDPRPGSGQPVTVEFAALISRYYRTLTRDRRTLALLVGQAPVLGLLIALVFGPGALGAGASATNAVELVLILTTAAVWLGASAAVREVVKERSLVERDFDLGVRLDAYILAKAVILFGLTALQVSLLTAAVLLIQPLGLSAAATLELLGLGILTAWTSVATGLLASCLFRSVDQAAGALPLLLIPQLLFAGALVPTAQMPGLLRAFSNVVYGRWAFAGLGSAADLSARIASSPAGAAGFSDSFFSVGPGTVAVVLLVFTVVQLFAAMLLLMNRPRFESA